MELEMETEVTVIMTLNREEAEWLKKTVQNAPPDESPQGYARRDHVWSFLKNAGIK